MLTIIIILMNFVIMGFGIFFLDYKNDGLLNDAPVIILCVISSTILTALITWAFIEITYLMLPKDNSHKSMFTHKLIKQITSVPLHFFRMRLKVTGLESLPKDMGFTIYSNHSSWIDPTLIMNSLYNYPVIGLGKESAFKIPIIGKFAPKLGFVMIIREDPRQSARAIKIVVSRVKEGYSMIIFPEGTRNSNHDTVLDFKAGAFKVALRSELPIVPLTLVKPIKKKWRLFTKIKIVVHEPIEYNDFKNMATIDIAKKVQKIIESSL